MDRAGRRTAGRRLLPLVIALVVAAGAKSARAGETTARIAKDRVAGGEHWRLQTLRGRVHVWRPGSYDRRAAGTVVYVHGYAVDADKAWEDHELARQFQASGRNAVFLVPEAPASLEEGVHWTSLTELLRVVGATLGFGWPPGPLVVVGHSAAHRTVVSWLKNPRLSHLILLDAVYGDDTVSPVRAWVRAGRGRLTVVAADTTADVERLVQGLSSTVRRGAIPESETAFTAGERRARVTYLRSQYGHLEMVTEGKAIPPLLGLTHLPRTAAAPKGGAARPAP